MIGLVLVTHGRLADEFRLAVEHVVGPQENFETVAIGADDDMEQRRRDIVEAVRRVDGGTGVILLTDMFGGTPSNLAISVMEAGRIEVIAGMNLPMLIKLSSVRKSDNMVAALDEAQAAGRKYINVASQLLTSKCAPCPPKLATSPVTCGSSTSVACMLAPRQSSCRSPAASTRASMSRRTAPRSAAPRSWA